MSLATYSRSQTGRDCIGGAKTGSGKTLAFALPIVERIARDPFGVWAVVLTPTRCVLAAICVIFAPLTLSELAYQLTEQFLAVGKPLGLKTVTIVGGMDSMAQASALEARPHIIVATPGRLCDLLRSDGVKGGKLARVKTLVRAFRFGQGKKLIDRYWTKLIVFSLLHSLPSFRSSFLRSRRIGKRVCLQLPYLRLSWSLPGNHLRRANNRHLFIEWNQSESCAQLSSLYTHQAGV